MKKLIFIITLLLLANISIGEIANNNNTQLNSGDIVNNNNTQLNSGDIVNNNTDIKSDDHYVNNIALALYNSMAYIPTIKTKIAWDKPTIGTPPVYYVIELSTNNGPWIEYTLSDSLSTTIQLNFYGSHRVRIAGVDIQGHQGPYGKISAAYIPADHLPHIPSKPKVISP